MAQQFCVAFSQACPQRRMPSSASPSSSNYRGFPRVSAPIPARDPTLDAGGKRVPGTQDAIAQAAGSCCCGTEAELLNSQDYGSWVGIGVGPLAPCVDPDRGSTRTSDWSERDRAIIFTSLLAGLRATKAAESPLLQAFQGFSTNISGPARLGFTAHVDDRQRPMGRGFSPATAPFAGADGERRKLRGVDVQRRWDDDLDVHGSRA